MTTTVKVITHDWPVAITTKDEWPHRAAVFATDHIPPHEERTFYLTDCRSIKLEELQKPEKAPAPETGATDYAWLIEARGNRSAPLYWDGGDWSADHLRAVRFRRKVDAERVMINIADAQRQPQMTAVEHGWMTKEAPVPVPAEPAAAIPIAAEMDKA